MSPMKNLIDRLMREVINEALFNAAPTDVEMTPPRIECQIVLKGGYAMAGVLTTTPEDTLRLLAPGKKAGGGEVMVDHYFAYDDVLTIAIGREIPRPSFLIKPA